VDQRCDDDSQPRRGDHQGMTLKKASRTRASPAASSSRAPPRARRSGAVLAPQRKHAAAALRRQSEARDLPAPVRRPVADGSVSTTSRK
jgi:hypothetical protein